MSEFKNFVKANAKADIGPLRHDRKTQYGKQSVLAYGQQ
jgi:hypothetical protein